jgi:hypothetical protein
MHCLISFLPALSALYVTIFNHQKKKKKENFGFSQLLLDISVIEEKEKELSNTLSIEMKRIRKEEYLVSSRNRH